MSTYGDKVIRHILFLRLPKAERDVLLYLCAAIKDWRETTIQTRLRPLAEECGWSVRQVQDALWALEEKGYLRKAGRVGSKLGLLYTVQVVDLMLSLAPGAKQGTYRGAVKLAPKVWQEKPSTPARPAMVERSVGLLKRLGV